MMIRYISQLFTQLFSKPQRFFKKIKNKTKKKSDESKKQKEKTGLYTPRANHAGGSSQSVGSRAEIHFRRVLRTVQWLVRVRGRVPPERHVDVDVAGILRIPLDLDVTVDRFLVVDHQLLVEVEDRLTP